MLARPVVAAGPFVDVVAEMKDDVEILGGHVAVRGEEAGLVVLAGGEREPQAVDVRARSRQRPRAADRARRVAGVEAIPVPAVGLEALDFDVHRVRPLRPRRSRGRCRTTLPHRLVVGDFPADVDRLRRHAAAVQRIGREPRPEHDAVRRRIAGRDTERERRRSERDVAPRSDGARETRRRDPAQSEATQKARRRLTDVRSQASMIRNPSRRPPRAGDRKRASTPKFKVLRARAGDA